MPSVKHLCGEYLQMPQIVGNFVDSPILRPCVRMAGMPNDHCDWTTRPRDPRGAGRGRAHPQRALAERVGIAPSTAWPGCAACAARRHPGLPRRDRPRRAGPAAAGDGRRAPGGPRPRADRRLHRRGARPARRAHGVPPAGVDRLPGLARGRRRAGPARVRRRPPRHPPGGRARGDVADLRAPPRPRHLGRGGPRRATGRGLARSRGPRRPGRPGRPGPPGPRWRRKRWNSRARTSPRGSSVGSTSVLLLGRRLLEALDERLHVGVGSHGQRDLALVLGGGGSSSWASTVTPTRPSSLRTSASAAFGFGAAAT